MPESNDFIYNMGKHWNNFIRTMEKKKGDVRTGSCRSQDVGAIFLRRAETSVTDRKNMIHNKDFVSEITIPLIEN